MSTLSNKPSDNRQAFFLTLGLWIIAVYILSIYIHHKPAQMPEPKITALQDSLDRYKQHMDSVESFPDHSRIPDN